MSTRSLAGRFFQTLFFEGAALALAVPLYALAFDARGGAALPILLAVSAAAFLWAALYRVLFDWFHWHLTRRPEALRAAGTGLLRRISGRATALLLTFPLLIWLGALGPREALLAALALAGLHAGLGVATGFLRGRGRPTALC
ncbi:chlorhexidine efflux transporter [Cereibacter sphaeroides]|uniref:chlorhexidine efflux transporter n=1 Tax=Cereibacter sphaeroides TaxID=1063 RepID=UPI0002A3538A|nr:chlorhexidine efflux transporter [Cereibacter sphaeroides]EKX56553.1 hypothetical protein D516_2909 [Rhodobacter sp. AKP1]MWP39711.1 hypothetical protein [Cereibacter sphaeroides]